MIRQTILYTSLGTKDSKSRRRGGDGTFVSEKGEGVSPSLSPRKERGRRRESCVHDKAAAVMSPGRGGGGGEGGQEIRREREE